MKSRGRLWKDGVGIERLPLTVRIDDGVNLPDEVPAVVVLTEDLLALEELLAEASNCLAYYHESSINWDSREERAVVFTRVDELWKRVGGVWRGDDVLVEDDDEVRPQ